MKIAAAGALVAGFAAPAMAGPTTADVDVNIEVLAEVSIGTDATVNLVLSGANIENSDASEKSLGWINNVPADIKVHVDGSLPPAGQLNFFIFRNVTAAGAIAAMHANANAPAGALKWTAANLNTEQNYASMPITQVWSTEPVTYAADAPNSLPLPGSWHLDVTWTIAPTP